MDYEKKYKEALEVAASAYKDTDRHLKATLERIFPELKESEDERIRKMLYGWVCSEPDSTFDGGYSKKNVLAWLEKQKPVDFSDEERGVRYMDKLFLELTKSESEEIKDGIIALVKNCYEEGGYALPTYDYNKYIGWLEKQREQKVIDCDNTLLTPDKKHLKDGVYYVCDDEDKTVVPYKAEVTAPEGTMGVLLVQGERSVIVALHDCNDGEKIKLTKRSDPTNLKGNYIGEYIDAVADWNGRQNTKHLKVVGTYKNINLNDDWYIPSMGEMLFIFTHKKEVNAALEKAGGQPISYDWYWTSTECDTEIAWIINQHYGSIAYITKDANQCMRLVSAFTVD